MRKSAEGGAPLARATKFVPLIWAGLSRRPARTLLGLVAVAIAFTLYGLALGEAVAFGRAAAARHVDIGQGFLLGALAVSAIGMTLILFITANAMAQSVRLRIGEFGVLKAIGFSHRLILALVATEAALPCLAGAVLGLVAAPLLLGLLKLLLPPLAMFPGLVYTPAMLAAATVLAVFIGGISGGVPAFRITRLDVAAALAGGLGATAPRPRDTPASASVAATPAVTRTTPVFHRIARTDMHLLRQILVVTRIGLSTLHHRRKGAAVIVAGIGMMVFVLLSFLSMGEGIRVLMLKTGDPAIALLHMESDRWLDRSTIPPAVAQAAAIAPWVARGKDGAPLVEAEFFGGIGLVKRNNGEAGSTAIMGVGPQWLQIMPTFHLVSGRMPRPDTRELVAGDLARRKFSGLDGGSAAFKGTRWRIVGTFSVDDWKDGYLLGDRAMLKEAAKRTADNVVRVRLTSVGAFDDFRRAVRQHLPSGIVVERETDHYAQLWNQIGATSAAFYIAYLLAGLIGAGMVAGTMHTMQSALEERAREVAILRVLGFDSVAVAASVILEAMLLAIIGAAFGAAMVRLWLDGFLYNGAGAVFIVRVDIYMLFVGSCWALVVALAGAFQPALRAARQTPIEALREV